MKNPFLLGIGLMNLGAAGWYWFTGNRVMGVSLALMAVAACIQAFGTVQ